MAEQKPQRPQPTAPPAPPPDTDTEVEIREGGRR
jgi:hypothetical protein